MPTFVEDYNFASLQGGDYRTTIHDTETGITIEFGGDLRYLIPDRAYGFYVAARPPTPSMFVGVSDQDMYALRHRLGTEAAMLGPLIDPATGCSLQVDYESKSFARFTVRRSDPDATATITVRGEEVDRLNSSLHFLLKGFPSPAMHSAFRERLRGASDLTHADVKATRFWGTASILGRDTEPSVSVEESAPSGHAASQMEAVPLVHHATPIFGQPAAPNPTRTDIDAASPPPTNSTIPREIVPPQEEARPRWDTIRNLTSRKNLVLISILAALSWWAWQDVAKDQRACVALNGHTEWVGARDAAEEYCVLPNGDEVPLAEIRG